MKRRRVLPLLVAAASVIAACGGDIDEFETTPDPVDEPDAEPAAGGDADELRAPTPVALVAGGPGGDATARSESAMVLPLAVEYEVDPALTELPTADTGYLFEVAGGASRDQVDQLAGALGLDGVAERLDGQPDAGWRIGPIDGSSPTLFVADDGPLSWYYNGAIDDAVVTACIEPARDQTAADETAADEPAADEPAADEPAEPRCDAPAPPAGVPTAEEAQARAADLFVALGGDAAAATYDTVADEWFATVTVDDPADVGSSLLASTFGFGGEGVLVFASGHLADPVAVGPYPLIDLDTAVERLRAGRYGFGGSQLLADVGETTDSAERSVALPEADVSSPAAAPDATPVTVTLVGVEADLWWGNDIDGSVWLLPAYRFVAADGGWHVVPAVTDDFLVEMPRPDGVPDGPLPVEPDGGIGDGAGPPPDFFTDLPLAPAFGPPATEGSGPVAAYFGLSLDDFTEEITALGYGPLRVVWDDGEYLAITEDFAPGRVNAAVQTIDGEPVVIDAFVEGIEDLDVAP